MRSTWRGDTQHADVLLLDGEYRQTLTALRAYAREGLRVAVVACESREDSALSLRSRYCSYKALVPDFTWDADGYVDALLNLVAEYQPALLLPAHDGSIQALRARRTELEQHTALGLAREPALDIAVSKPKTLALAAELGVAIPRSVPIADLNDLVPALHELGLPAVIKPLVSWVESERRGIRLSSEPVETLDQGRANLRKILAAGGKALLQEWLPGRREAVSLFYAHGRFWGRLAQISHREWPVMGGASVLCESIPLAPDITDASERLVRAIDLEGCSMVEFRRNREGRPVLMEINPRMGGSLALAISCGVNFPKLMYDWKLGRRLEATTHYRVGQRLRWVAGDVWNIKTVMQRQGQVDVPRRDAALVNFAIDWLRPGTQLDVFELGDMEPALCELNKVVFHYGARRLRRLVTGLDVSEQLIAYPGEVI
jgi:predicted ATP-grasp superfamily ATP-dependent carboligase